MRRKLTTTRKSAGTKNNNKEEADIFSKLKVLVLVCREEKKKRLDFFLFSTMYSWVGFCFVGHLWAVVIVTRHESWFRPFEPRGVRMYGACFSTDRKTTYHAPPFVLHELLKRRCAMCTSFFFSSLTSSTEPSFFFRLITFFLCVFAKRSSFSFKSRVFVFVDS